MAGVNVVVTEDESFERSIKRFRTRVQKAGILKEAKQRRYYDKPSVKRKKKALAARKRWLRRMNKARARRA